MKDASITVRVNMPDYSALPTCIYEWTNSVYGEQKEQIPHNAPELLGKPIITTTWVDANLMHDVLSGKSVTGVLHMVNKTPFDWCAKKQSTVETATFGSEIVAARTEVEQKIGHRDTLRYLGVPVSEHSFLFGDNKTVVKSSALPEGKLHKRHNMSSFHKVRETIAAGFIQFHHLVGTNNPADILSKHWEHSDILSKHWEHSDIWHLLRPFVFCQKDVIFSQKEIAKCDIPNDEQSTIMPSQTNEI